METILNYLIQEKLLNLITAIIGCASILVGIIIIIFFPNFKSFGITLTALGLMEAIIFFSGYMIMDTKIKITKELFEIDPKSFFEEQMLFSVKMVKISFAIKLISTISILLIVLATALFNFSEFINNFLFALALHFSFAIVMGNFNEQYHKRYIRDLTEIQAME